MDFDNECLTLYVLFLLILVMPLLCVIVSGTIKTTLPFNIIASVIAVVLTRT